MRVIGHTVYEQANHNNCYIVQHLRTYDMTETTEKTTMCPNISPTGRL